MRLKTALCDRLGIELPIIQAPMGGAVGPSLAAAVSNAGGLGMLVLWRADLDTVRQQIRQTRALTSRPFGVNLNLDFPQEDRLAVCLEERVPVVSFFWRDPSSLVPRAKAGGAVVLHIVGSAADARHAVSSGVDVIVAQGWEAGGHVRGTVATMALVPAVVDCVSPVPVVAAGGIADGEALRPCWRWARPAPGSERDFWRAWRRRFTHAIASVCCTPTRTIRCFWRTCSMCAGETRRIALSRTRPFRIGKRRADLRAASGPERAR